MQRRRIAMLGCLALAAFGLLGAEGNPRELGQVKWQRDFPSATSRASESGKPLFALFQEIPGCATCVSFGDQVLSQPQLVEAIESEFVPVAVYNNRGGADAALLERFAEPAWNNPVVRFLNAEGRDLLPRQDRVWEAHRVGERMMAALQAAGRPVPAYLEDAVDELRPRATEQATFGMHCFWSGEACLGGIEGVQASRAGFLAGREVVELSYDPKSVSYGELLRKAKSRGCADNVFAHNQRQQRAAAEIFGTAVRLADGYARSAPASDQKRQLRGHPLAKLELSPRQATRVNAALGTGRSPLPFLTPRQRATLQKGAR